MRQKQAVTREKAKKYTGASKKEKGKILDDLIELTGYNRSYAARVLRREANPKKKKLRGGKRLAPYLPEAIPVLERFKEIELDDEVRQKLLEVSAATIDRLLAPVKKQYQIKARSNTKPGTLLKHQAPDSPNAIDNLIQNHHQKGV